MSAICEDCGIDTTPCTHRRGCRHIGKWEWYMVKDAVWLASGMGDGCLCVGCLEERLGRQLVPDDFSDCILNDVHLNDWMTERLRSRIVGDSKWILAVNLTAVQSWDKE